VQNGGEQEAPPLGTSDPSKHSPRDDRLPADEQGGQTGANKSGHEQPLGDARGPHETARAQVDNGRADVVLKHSIGIMRDGSKYYVGPGKVRLPHAEIARLQALPHRVIADT